jgi:hypothetical protein
MKPRMRRYEKATALEMLLLRDRLGLKRFRKAITRDPEERAVLLSLALNKMKKADRSRFLTLGPHRTKLILK